VCLLDAACVEVGAHEGLLEVVLTSTLQSPQYVSAVSRFDLVILVRVSIHYLSLCLVPVVLVTVPSENTVSLPSAAYFNSAHCGIMAHRPMLAPGRNAPLIRFLILALYILFACLCRMLPHLSCFQFCI